METLTVSNVLRMGILTSSVALRVCCCSFFVVWKFVKQHDVPALTPGDLPCHEVIVTNGQAQAQKSKGWRWVDHTRLLQSGWRPEFTSSKQPESHAGAKQGSRCVTSQEQGRGCLYNGTNIVFPFSSIQRNWTIWSSAAWMNLTYLHENIAFAVMTIPL